MTLKSKDVTWRTAAFLSSGAVIVAVVWLFASVGHLQITGEYSSQTLLIPCLCGYLLWNERERIFAGIESAPSTGLKVVIVAVVSGLAAVYFHRTGDAYLFSATALLSAILLTTASFIGLYGQK